jgi:hypothetical protein
MNNDRIDKRSTNTVSSPAPLPVLKRPWSRPVLTPESVAHRTDSPKHPKYYEEGAYNNNYIGTNS